MIVWFFLFGATNGNRTRDLYLTKVALYRLSYSSIFILQIVLYVLQLHLSIFLTKFIKKIWSEDDGKF